MDASCGASISVREKSFGYSQSVSQLGAVAFTDRSHIELPEALEFTYKVKRWQADARGCCPVLQSRINVDWLTFDPQMFAPLFPRLKEGILRDVFIQKAVVAWDHAPSNRIMVSLLLPGPMEADQWLHDVRTSRNMWPLQKTSHVMANQLATETFMRRERRRLQARHIWEKIEPNWPMIEERVWTKQATQASHTKRFLGASFCMIIRKNLGGWKIRTRDRTSTGSNSSGNVAGHGLQGKPLRSLRANGSVLCISTDLIRSMLCHGNGLITMRI